MRLYRTVIKRHRRIDGCETKLENFYPRNRTRLRVYSMMTIIMMIYNKKKILTICFQIFSVEEINKTCHKIFLKMY